MTKQEFIKKVAYQPYTHFYDNGEHEAMAKVVLVSDVSKNTLGKIMFSRGKW